VNVCDGTPGVAVYTGSTLAGLTLVAGGDGDCSANFTATAATTYKIAVADFDDGDFTLEIKQGGVIITNGTVQLGVRPEGHLNAAGGTPSSGEGTETVGIRYVPTNADSVSPGCECEGWGAADDISDVTGFANESTDGGANNITVNSFTADADSAISVVDIGTTLRVTHNYEPAPGQPNLYMATVTIRNISASNVDPRYRRVMDWDIEPTAFDDWVTIGTGDAARLIDNNNDGFATANPLGPDTSGALGGPLFNGGFLDQGPYDHGARFDFGFPTLMPTQEVTFTIYYGAAATEVAAINALDAVNAEVYSIGEPNTPDGPTLGTPNTFVFGFTGVGGTDIGDAPNTTIDSGPSGATSSPDPTFTYSGNPATTDFVCQLSGAVSENLAQCPAAGKSYSGLPDGSYTFRVSAVSAGGSADPSPAARSFTIDTTTPPPPPVGTGVAPVATAPVAGPTGLRAAALAKCKKKTGAARHRCRKKARKLPV
jgi:hypothetical protein